MNVLDDRIVESSARAGRQGDAPAPAACTADIDIFDEWAWSSASVSHAATREQTCAARSGARLYLVVKGKARGAARFANGGGCDVWMGPGAMIVVPPATAMRFHFDAPLETLQIVFARSALETVGQDCGAYTANSLKPFFGLIDPCLEQLALRLLELSREAGADADAHIAHFVRAMAAQTLRKCSTVSGPAEPACSGAMSAKESEAIGAYIAANLASSLSLKRLAAQSGRSEGHYARLFKATFGETPHRYVVRQRVAHARRLLSQTEEPIAAISDRCGFAHQMHLTQLFRRFTGTTPGQYRKDSRRAPEGVLGDRF